jgi:hypothetical protein
MRDQGLRGGGGVGDPANIMQRKQQETLRISKGARSGTREGKGRGGMKEQQESEDGQDQDKEMRNSKGGGGRGLRGRDK